MSYLGKRKSGGAPLLSGKKRLVYRVREQDGGDVEPLQSLRQGSELAVAS